MTVSEIQSSLDYAESIASRDLNNLYLASRFFRDRKRYLAFCAYYAVMRVVDDRVDDLSARRPVPADELAAAEREVRAWRRAIRGLYDGASEPSTADREALGGHAALLAAFGDALARFPVPRSLWENFFDAMERDLREPRFDSFGEFLDYAEGATVAPTTIYLSLLASSETAPGDERYAPPEDFELIECGRRLGLFAYLVHILRDLPKDLSAGESSLIYLAGDDMAAYAVTDEMLAEASERGVACDGLRALLAELGRRARGYLDSGRALVTPLRGKITPDCEFVLELIIGLYEELLARIKAQGFDPFPEKHQLGLLDKRRLVMEIARRVGFPMDVRTVAHALGL
jgi:phytoene/squalene synthetase